MRVLIINSMFYTQAYRRCVDELGKFPDIELTVLTVDSWIMNDRVGMADPLAPDAPYAFVKGTTGWSGKENRGFYTSGLATAFKLSKPEVIFLMEEPFSLFALQVLFFRAIFAPNAPIVFFTWNNLSFRVFDYRPSIWYRLVSRWTLDRFAGALTANDDGIQVLRDAGFGKPIEKIGYGVETERFAHRDELTLNSLRSCLGLNANTIVIGYIGRILWMKGLDLLLEAIAMLEREDIRILLVGSGDYESEFLRLAQKLGLAGQIIHLPSIPHNEVAQYMQLIDIFVLPSRRVKMWAEQFGRVAIEAMAAGAIVIGSDSGAIPEVIGDGGFIFEENDKYSLAIALHKALDLSPEQRSSMIAHARERAQTTFTWRKFATQAAGFIQNIYRSR
ncbi:MAG TPA: glycosyltransferase [Candidatus Kapabacteria bacterium]|nr:glycosyltransferase [Candidatus Kapabacteria bacterium]